MICRIDWLEVQADNIKAIDKAESISVEKLESTEKSYEEFMEQYKQRKIGMTLTNVEDLDFTCEICEKEIDGNIYGLTYKGKMVYEQLCEDCMREIIKHGLEVADYDEWERR